MLKIRKNLEKYNRKSYLNTKKTDLEINEIIDCSFGDKPYLIDRRVEEIWSLPLSKLTTYPEASLYSDLKKVLITRFNLDTGCEKNIFLGHGSFNIMERIIHKLVNPGKMLGIGPQFNEIPSEFELAGGVYETVESLGNHRLLSELVTKIRTKQYDVLYIDNPNNPTGFYYDLDFIDKLALECDRAGTIFLVDEAYCEFLSDKSSSFNIFDKHKTMIIVRSFSKTSGLAGVRSGYAVFCDDLAEFYKKITVPFEPSLASLLISLQVVDDLESLEATRKQTTLIKKSFLKYIKSNEVITVLPTSVHTPICTIHIPNIDLYKKLLSIGVIGVSGVSFKNTSVITDSSYVRLCLPTSTNKLDDLINRLSLIG